MLKKLLKYDMRSVWKLWLALSISVLGMSAITSLVLRAAMELSLADPHMSSVSVVMSTLGTLSSAFLMVMTWVAMLLVVPLMCYIRYYKNFFSDEGYLTFTLPVRRKTLYLSKVINVFIFQAANLLVTVLAVLIMMLIIPASVDGQLINFAAFEAIGQLIYTLWQGIHGWIFAYIPVLLLLLVVSALCQIGLIHLCITVGATVAKRHKVLAGVGIYFGSYFVLSTVTRILGLFTADAYLGFFSLLSGSTGAETHAILLTLLLLVGVAMTTVTMILHFFTLHIIERKLNLA